MDILKFFVIILLAFFPLGEIVRIGIAPDVAVTASDVIVGLIFIVWCSKLGISRGKQLSGVIMGSIIGLVLTLVISLVLNSSHYAPNQLFVGMLYLLRFSAYTSLYFVVRAFSDEFKQKLLYILLVVGSIVVIGGVLQYLFYPALRNLYYAGWDEHLYRVFSSFFDPNFAAAFFVLYIILLLSILFIKQNLFKNSQIIITILLSVTTVDLFLTYSRSGYLMLLVSLIAFFIIIRKKKYILLGVLLIVLGIFLVPKNLKSEGVNLLRTASITARSESFNRGVKIFLDHPVLGVGFDTYRYAQNNYGFITDKKWQTTHSGAGTDNSFLFIAATSGIIGLFAFITLLFQVIVNAVYSARVEQHTVSKIAGTIVAASFVGLVVDSLFINAFFYPLLLEWMWILVGLSDRSEV